MKRLRLGTGRKYTDGCVRSENPAGFGGLQPSFHGFGLHELDRPPVILEQTLKGYRAGPDDSLSSRRSPPRRRVAERRDLKLERLSVYSGVMGIFSHQIRYGSTVAFGRPTNHVLSRKPCLPRPAPFAFPLVHTEVCKLRPSGRSSAQQTLPSFVHEREYTHWRLKVATPTFCATSHSERVGLCGQQIGSISSSLCAR